MDRQRQASLGLSALGLIIGLIAIFVFMTAFTLDAWCPEENQSEVIRDGETVISCEGSGMWNGTIARLFLACCIFVPLSTLLTTVGVVLRKVKSESENVDLEVRTSEGSSESAIVPILQSMAQWFGVGLTGIVMILAVGITAFVMLGLYAVFSSGSLFG